MCYNNLILDFEKKQKDIRNKLLKEDSPLFSFMNIGFSEKMNIGLLTKEELVIGHTYIHQKFSNNKTGSIIYSKIHQKFTSSMKKHGLNHFYIDKLDKT